MCVCGVQDGRLSRGDRILQLNEESVIHMRSEDVAARLRSLDDAREAIRLVVAHSEREGESQTTQEVIPEVMDVSVKKQLWKILTLSLPLFPSLQSSGDEMDEFEVELYKEGRGLGITIAGLVSEDTGGQSSEFRVQLIITLFLCLPPDELKGLYITSINSQGAVGKDGRAKVNDRILRVDGHSLRGLENMEAAAVLRNSGNPVTLVFGRPKVEGDAAEREEEEEEEEEGEEGEEPTLRGVGGRGGLYLVLIVFAVLIVCPEC